MSGLRPHPFPRGLGRYYELWGRGWGGAVASTMDRVLVFWLSLGNLGRLCPGPRCPESNAHHRMMGAGGLASSRGALLSWERWLELPHFPQPGCPSVKEPVTAMRGEGTRVDGAVHRSPWLMTLLLVIRLPCGLQ